MRDLSRVSFIRTLIPFIEGRALPKAPLLNTITLGVRFHHMHSVGTQMFSLQR